MEIVTIEQQHHEVLREPAKAVTFPLSEENRQFALALRDKMIELGNAVGLAATQVGKSLQIIAFHVPHTAAKMRKNVHAAVEPTILINPRYEPIIEDGTIIDWEGCFSIPDRMGEVPRYNTIHYEAYLMSGEKVSGIAHGFLARVLQHEIGHLNGQLFKDLLTNQCRFGTLDEMMKIRMEELKKNE